MPLFHPNPYRLTWAKPLPADTAVADDQSPVTGEGGSVTIGLLSQIASPWDSVGVNNGAYGISGCSVPRTQPQIPVSVTPGANDFLPSTGPTVPYPMSLPVPAGSDGAVVIYQASTDTEINLWRVIEGPGPVIQASWGGKLDGCRTTTTGCFANPYGCSASGISLLGTTVTFDDVQCGRIDHVIGIVVEQANGWVPPAVRDADSNTPGGIPYGTWYRMPLTVAMPGGLTAWGKLVFTALQEYGAVVTDKSGAVMITAQSAADWTGPGLDPITASWDGQPEYDADNGIPWDSLVVINPPQW